MPVIYGYRGDRHNLSKGAFDSVSVAKPGTASLLLAEYLPKSWDESFAQLSTGYQAVVREVEQGTLKNSLWTSYVKPGLKKAGSYAWEVAKPFMIDAVGQMAGLGPTASHLIAAVEGLFSEYLDSSTIPFGSKESQSLTLNTGQWIFIEKDESLQRRRRLKGISTGEDDHPIKPKDVKKMPKVVDFGFYVGAAYGDTSKLSVFNMDLGRTQEVDAKAVRPAGTEVAKKVDGDEKLSLIRELYFYKSKAYEFNKKQPDAIMPGREVDYNDKDYTLIETNGINALLEDDKGNTEVVDFKLVSRGKGKSTPGQQSAFDKSNQKGLYAGMWVLAPAREFLQNRYAADVELAVLHEILKAGKVEIFYAFDGRGAYEEEDNIIPYGPNFQQLYSAKPGFKHFKQAAIDGSMEDTTRYELGSKFAKICVNDYSESLETLGDTEPDPDPDKSTKTLTTVEDYTEETIKVGNDAKKTVDAETELQNKIGVLTGAEVEEILEGESWEYEDEGVDEGGGDGMVLGLIALTALVFIGFGGAAAAIPAIPI